MKYRTKLGKDSIMLARVALDLLTKATKNADTLFTMSIQSINTGKDGDK